jgi:hypothetical protein
VWGERTESGHARDLTWFRHRCTSKCNTRRNFPCQEVKRHVPRRYQSKDTSRRSMLVRKCNAINHSCFCLFVKYKCREVPNLLAFSIYGKGVLLTRNLKLLCRPLSSLSQVSCLGRYSPIPQITPCLPQSGLQFSARAWILKLVMSCSSF